MDERTMPLVSIGLTTYNGEKIIRRAIDSLLAQTYSNFELIIADNASTDATAAISEEYLKNDSRIRYMRHENNLGYAKNFYSVVEASRGKYFMWAADDDRWAPEFIETLVSALEANPDYGVALSSFQWICRDGAFYEEYLMSGKNNVTNYGHYDLFKKIFTKEAAVSKFIFGIFRRELIEKAAKRPLAQCNSWDNILMSEIALVTRFYSVAPVLLFFETRLKLEKKNKPPPQAYFIPYEYTKALFTAFYRAITSSMIPLKRKIFLFIPLAKILWHERNRFIGISFNDLRRLGRKDYWKKKFTR